ncbi:MAG: hypothetical protein H7A53_11445 [Akkermansiaceae bacterium]|nr:hypothetical protein [Akkermansiaceae bacterium]MCP5551493.1 hypothetical protein [Akkermansiaceae bacterium]
MNLPSDLQLLLVVKDLFQIQERGLVLSPDFSVPGRNWKSRTETVILEIPDGIRFEARAIFQLSHFNIRDPDVSIDRRWRVTVCLPDLKAEEVPVGTRLFAPFEVVAMLANQFNRV